MVCIQVSYDSHVCDRVSRLKNTMERNQILTQHTCQAMVEYTLQVK